MYINSIVINKFSPIVVFSVVLWILLAASTSTWKFMGETPDTHYKPAETDNLKSQTVTEQWQDVSVSWRLDDNFRNEGGRFGFTLKIMNESAEPLPGEGWVIYFNFQRMIDDDSVPDNLHYTWINGDFHRLAPASGFETIAAGDKYSFSFEGFGSAINYSDAPSGFYVVVNEDHENPRPIGPVQVAPIEEDHQLNRSPDDNVTVSSPSERFLENQDIQELSHEALVPVLPTPKRFERFNQTVMIDPLWAIHHDAGLASEANLLAGRIETIIGNRPDVIEDLPGGDAVIVLRLDTEDSSEEEESYKLKTGPGNVIEITAPGPAGIFYGIQTLVGLMPFDESVRENGQVEIPAVYVSDSPRFAYRGYHLDVSRHFETAEDVKNLLDILGFYKLNRFHFHLTDDEGWRIAINGLPELTDVGGHRGHTLTERDHLIPSLGSGHDPEAEDSYGNGYYDRDEYIEILRYAAERHIEVIPEIDVPGHARAAIVAMEARYHRLAEEGDETAASEFRLQDPDDKSEYRSVQQWEGNVINVCIPSAYHFMETVIDDLIAIYEEAGAPLSTIHIGGDEVPQGAWTASPACDEMIAEKDELNSPEDLESYFIEQVTEIIAKRGLITGGWEEAVLVPSEEDDRYMYAPNPALKNQPFITYVWNNIWGGGGDDRGYKLANAGYNVILAHASSLYFDIPYEKHPAEPGLYWAGFVDLKDPFFFTPFDVFQTIEYDLSGNPLDHDEVFSNHMRIGDDARDRIYGIQGQLWGQLWNEDVLKVNRLDYMTFPRAIALAERAWAPQPPWEDELDTEIIKSERFKGWQKFVNQLGQFHLPRLDSFFEKPVAYRLPPPGAVFDDDYLYANSEIPGLMIRYTTDGSKPTSDSEVYSDPIRINNTVKLRSFDTNGRGSRTVKVQP